MKLPSGTAVYFGPPANPLDAETRARIVVALSRVAGIAEAHLPQCYAKDFIDPPAQILVLALEPGVNPETVMPEVNHNLKTALPIGRFIDIFPLAPDHPFLPLVRRCDTKLIF